jgi:hypothetical protein
MKRIGIMGCGSVADFGHGPAIKQIPGFELVAAFDPNPEAVQAFAAKFEVASADTTLDSFFDQHLDAVVIASPPHFHLQMLWKQPVMGATSYARSPLPIRMGRPTSWCKALPPSEESSTSGSSIDSARWPSGSSAGSRMARWEKSARSG